MNELPAVDETLKAFIARAQPTAPEEARALFSRHRSRVEAGEQRFRLLLYLVSLLLLIMLVLLGLRLRARAVALRRRAAFEHVIAENSTRLINCSPAETGGAAEAGAGRFRSDDRRGSRICGAGRETHPGRTHGPRTENRSRRAGLDQALHCPGSLARLNRTLSPFRRHRLAARSGEGRADGCRRARLDLRAVDPTGPGSKHHGF